MARSTLWLVGMMGAGKSTVGAVLARRLARPFVDTDAEIEREAGRSIAALFAGEGEAGFRRRERRAIGELCGREAVVALGGGAIAQPGMEQRLARAGTVVYLRARPETLLGRLGDCRDRPLLRDASPAARLDRLRALLRERAAAYESAAIVVDTDELGPELLAERIERALEARGGECGAR